MTITALSVSIAVVTVQNKLPYRRVHPVFKVLAALFCPLVCRLRLDAVVMKQSMKYCILRMHTKGKITVFDVP